MKTTINFSTGSRSFDLEYDEPTHVKRTEYDMSQRPEYNALYVDEIRYCGKNKNLYLVHAEDVLIGESIYDANGQYKGYRL